MIEAMGDAAHPAALPNNIASLRIQKLGTLLAVNV